MNPDRSVQKISPAAAVQRRLWGTDPRAWADLAESHNRPLFEAVLDAAGVGPGTRVLEFRAHARPGRRARRHASGPGY